MKNNKSEKMIVEQVNQKKMEGFRYLYNNYYPSLCGFSSRFFRQKDLAEDIVQDVFMRLWKSDSSFNSIKALKSYLYFSVKNASLNAIRNDSKLSDVDVQNNLDILSLKLEDKTIEQVLIEEEYYRQVYVAIERLSPERKKIILLSLEGLTNKEIADKTNVSINTVKSLKLRAYGVLRKELDWSAFLFLVYRIK